MKVYMLYRHKFNKQMQWWDYTPFSGILLCYKCFEVGVAIITSLHA